MDIKMLALKIALAVVILGLVAHIGIAFPPEMCLVPAGGQPQGPEYDFLMSKYEITNQDYIYFLNDLRQKSKNVTIPNVAFDNLGNVRLAMPQEEKWRNSAMVFSMTVFEKQTDIVYENGHYKTTIGREKHPVQGVSWFGANMFCHWLTIKVGMSRKELCYSEGPFAEDWHPVHICFRQWKHGFTQQFRKQWIHDFRGFRLPMDDCSSRASAYNEYYKAAAWNGRKNTLYGFGRDTIDEEDANYGGSGDPFENHRYFPNFSTPVGYYDGTLHDGCFQTRKNENHYGIFDLSGNAGEIVEDFHHTGALLWRLLSVNSVEYRAVRGGSWGGAPINVFRSNQSMLRTDQRIVRIHIYDTRPGIGFRIVRCPLPKAQGPKSPSAGELEQRGSQLRH